MVMAKVMAAMIAFHLEETFEKRILQIMEETEYTVAPPDPDAR